MAVMEVLVGDEAGGFGDGFDHVLAPSYRHPSPSPKAKDHSAPPVLPNDRALGLSADSGPHCRSST